MGKRIGTEDEERWQSLEQRADHHEEDDGQGEESDAPRADAADPLAEGLRHPLAHQDPRKRRRRREHPQRRRGHDSALRELSDDLRCGARRP